MPIQFGMVKPSQLYPGMKLRDRYDKPYQVIAVASGLEYSQIDVGRPGRLYHPDMKPREQENDQMVFLQDLSPLADHPSHREMSEAHIDDMKSRLSILGVTTNEEKGIPWLNLEA